MSEGVATLEVREPSARYLVQDQKPLVLAFDAVATALCGVSQLRAFICSLAVRGLLVSQETAEESVTLIFGKSRGLPLGWNWARIEEICDVQGGIQKTQLRLPKKNHFPYLRVANIQRDRLSLDRIERFELADDEVVRWALRRGDLLVVEGNGSADEVGRCAMWDGSIDPCVFQNHLMRLRPHVAQTVGFLKLFLNSPDGAAEMKRLAVTTSGLYNLCVGKIRKISVPFPPLAEQHRIVARVEELMKLCDALEQSGRLADEQHARLTSTLFDALAASESAHALAENWHRVAKHFDLLLDRPEAIDAFEQTILQLAVSGCLSPQRSADAIFPSAAEAASTPQLPFRVPSSWRWSTLSELSALVTSGSRSWKDYYSTEGSIFIRSQDIKADRLEFDNRAFVKLPPTAEGLRTQVRRHDLLITITGANVGKAAVLNEAIEDAYVSQHVALVRLHEPQMADFIHLWLVNAYGGRKLLLGSSYGAKPGLNLKNVKDLPVPVPPLAEQHRIVARVEELRRLCADLRQRLTQARETQSRLADALVAEVA